jgi:hypothetical protein
MLPLMLVQTVIQAYSPAEFRGGTMAIFQMTQVVLVVGAMLVGALSTLIGAHWAATSKSIPGDSNDGRNLFLNAACPRDTLGFTPLSEPNKERAHTGHHAAYFEPMPCGNACERLGSTDKPKG